MGFVDESATWRYWSSMDDGRVEIPDEWVWERLRNQRDSLLMQTDHRMVSDAPWDSEPWAAYRQALRDLPEQTSDPREAIWPDPPTD
jgi:hypothetical protein